MNINTIGHLVKTNPIQTQSKPVLSAVEWANLRKAKMDVNLYFIEDYRKKDDFVVRINKANSQNAQNERKLNFNKGLQKKRLFSTPKNKPNSNPIYSKAKMNANDFSQKDYENKTAFRLEQNKPKKSQGIKRVRNIFRGFILTILTQPSHINITTPIVDRKRDPSQNEQKKT